MQKLIVLGFLLLFALPCTAYGDWMEDEFNERVSDFHRDLTLEVHALNGALDDASWLKHWEKYITKQVDFLKMVDDYYLNRQERALLNGYTLEADGWLAENYLCAIGHCCGILIQLRSWEYSAENRLRYDFYISLEDAMNVGLVETLGNVQLLIEKARRLGAPEFANQIETRLSAIRENYDERLADLDDNANPNN